MRQFYLPLFPNKLQKNDSGRIPSFSFYHSPDAFARIRSNAGRLPLMFGTANLSLQARWSGGGSEVDEIFESPSHSLC